TQSASLELIARQTQVANIPPLVLGPYRIQLFDRNNNQLADYRFTPHAGSEDSNLLSFGQIVNFIPGTRRIAIFSDLANKNLVQVDVSANEPTVTNVRLNDTQEPLHDTVTLAWIGNDPDKDPLTYTLLYSSDNKANWQVIAIGVRSTSFDIDTSTLEGTNGTR